MRSVVAGAPVDASCPRPTPRSVPSRPRSPLNDSNLPSDFRATTSVRGSRRCVVFVPRGGRSLVASKIASIRSLNLTFCSADMSTAVA